MNHYNYKITNINTGQFYIGVRSCKCDIKDDKYMGSSTVWTKQYIKDNVDVLKKEIIAEFKTRKEAAANEAKLLHAVEGNMLCINRYFGVTPDLTGTHQTPEHIAKRRRFGKDNGMYGKHHTEETKRKMSVKCRQYRHTDEVKRKISQKVKGKKRTAESRAKISRARSKTYRIVDTIENKEYIMTANEFNALHPEIKQTTIRKGRECGYLVAKRYRIYYAASVSNDMDKLGENGGNSEVSNPVGSAGSAKEYSEPLTTNN